MKTFPAACKGNTAEKFQAVQNQILYITVIFTDKIISSASTIKLNKYLKEVRDNHGYGAEECFQIIRELGAARVPWIPERRKE
jgi:hypothetical protein